MLLVVPSPRTSSETRFIYPWILKYRIYFIPSFAESRGKGLSNTLPARKGERNQVGLFMNSLSYNRSLLPKDKAF